MTDSKSLDEIEALLAKATADPNQLSGVACKHGWDTTVCPMRGCGPDIEADTKALLDAVPSLIAAARERDRLQAEVERLRETLIDAGDVLERAGTPSRVDPAIAGPVCVLGSAIGYGALMSTASALWREALGELAGAEFSASVCVSTAASRARRIDAALAGQP
jgi:hypothetical protein